MKPFNLFITVSLIVILGGFVFFKDGFNRAQSQPSDTAELRMDTLNYLNYSDSALSTARLKGTSVLFFAATRWCQTCTELEKEIIERSAEIPEDVTILKVDYDNDRAIKQKYGVTSQHTLVMLDQNGKEIKRWLGGDFNALLQQINEI